MVDPWHCYTCGRTYVVPARPETARRDTVARRVCAEAGCPTITDGTRCPKHTRQRDRARGSSTARGYDYKHQQLRVQVVASITRGENVTCWRCSERITSASDLHIGHDDIDRSITRGPEHALCNLSAAGRASHT